jgi:methionine synthase II (cobalamin-independent)
MSYNFNFLPTGIGSLPQTDAQKAIQLILKFLPDIPFWPQLPQRTFLEGMAGQFSQGLPNLVIEPQNKVMYIDTSSDTLDKEITTFYEKYLSDDLPYFAISREYAAGFYGMSEMLESFKPLPVFIKGQITGPITFSALITDVDGKAIMHHPVLSDVLVKFLIMKALWQIKTFANLGLKCLIFLDEPYLMGYGSAFIPLEREKVINQLTEIISEIHKEDVLAGIHCCGNTDWSMILDTPLDILSVDAFGFIDKLLLYSAQLQEFINRGGVIAWGIVPSIVMDKIPSAEEIITRLKDAIDVMVKKGIDRERLIRQSILTPSCGLGGLSESQANQRLQLLTDVHNRIKSLQ